MHSFAFIVLLALLATPFGMLLHYVSYAQVMSSTNYQLQSDSINVGGGYSSSTNYQQESTVGEIATGESTSTSYTLRAGYQQMQSVYIALSAAADVVMSPSIPGVTGGTAQGSTTVTVTTDSLAGYELTIRSNSAPTLRNGVQSIADYSPAGGVPDFLFTTAATDAHLGYSPEGVDITAQFLDSGGVCGSGTDTPDRCWKGLDTDPVIIASTAGSNHPAGTQTAIKFQVGIGSSVNQPPGVYTGTTTLTAIAQ